MNILPRTIPGIVFHQAEVRPGHAALIDGEVTLTYAAVREAMLALAAALVGAGLRQGDRIGIWLPNGAPWVIACLGAQAAGGVIVPLNTRYKAGEAEPMLAKARVRFLIHAERFADSDFTAMLGAMVLPHLERCIAVSPDAPAGDAFSAFLASGDAEARAEAEARLAALGPDDVADILFTSGTTGTPKGVVATHGQNVRTYAEWNRATTLRDDDRYLVIWPFCHCSGYKSGWLAGFIAGATVIPMATFDVDRVIEATARLAVTFLPGPPTVFQALLVRAEDPAAQTALRVVGTGGTMIDPALIRAIRSRLGTEVVYAGYGLTECCGTATMIRGDDPPEMVVHSSGRAIPGTELATMAANGALLPAGAEGELVTRGFHVMQGYLDDPAATAQVIDAAGWLHTGDLGTIDADGFVHITGRAKDMYIAGGFNCYPAEIENTIQMHPAVREVAVIGAPDARLGEVGLAFVAWNDAAVTRDGDALIAWCRDRMANYKVPRAVHFVDALPRNAMGKVEKFRLTQIGSQGEKS